jgi:uncharacterized protein YbjT (DUF2867 family)
MSNVALIVGATGLVGSAVLDLLLKSEHYSKVISLQRKQTTMTHAKLTTIYTDFSNLDALILPNCTDVYCCLGTTIKVAGSKKQFKKVDYEFPLAVAKRSIKMGAKHFLVVTAMGANSKSFIFYNKVKGELEDQLALLTDIRQISILQPSLLLGKRTEKRIGESFGIAVVNAINTVFKNSLGIQSTDVAKAMLLIAINSNKVGVCNYTSKQLKTLAAVA